MFSKTIDCINSTNYTVHFSVKAICNYAWFKSNVEKNIPSVMPQKTVLQVGIGKEHTYKMNSYHFLILNTRVAHLILE